MEVGPEQDAEIIEDIKKYDTMAYCNVMALRQRYHAKFNKGGTIL